VLIAAGEPTDLGSDHPRVVMGEEAKPAGSWAGRRSLQVDGTPAFELSYWCGTCPFLFRRLEGANRTLSISDLTDRLARGLGEIDHDVLSSFGELLPRGTYVPMLIELAPVLRLPSGDGDYFAEDQVRTWGLEPFWGLPVYPATPYYRSFETAVDHDAHLYEFVVPMVPPSWNAAAVVAEYGTALGGSSLPTAVAVSTLDVCEPAVDNASDHCAHWGLTHFLLDGHHKMQAAANGGRALRLLSLLSVEASLAEARHVFEVPALRARRQRTRTEAG
jgi:hypothetical protein